jgi:hypothetical protein
MENDNARRYAGIQITVLNDRPGPEVFFSALAHQSISGVCRIKCGVTSCPRSATNKIGAVQRPVLRRQTYKKTGNSTHLTFRSSDQWREVTVMTTWKPIAILLFILFAFTATGCVYWHDRYYDRGGHYGHHTYGYHDRNSGHRYWDHDRHY